MRKATRYYLLALIMFLLACLQAISGFVLWLVLPGGGGYMKGGGGGLVPEATFLWSRHIWIDVHTWVAIALLAIVGLHLILHWRWIVHMTKTYLRQQK